MTRFGRGRPSAVLPLMEIAGASGRREAQMGVLARSLAHVDRSGVAIPDTWVVLADVCRHAVNQALPPGHDPASLLRTIQRGSGIERAARARERLFSVSLEETVEEELDRAWDALSQKAPFGLAVRASAVTSDLGVARAAGLASTELGVFTREGLGSAIRRVWALSASEATLTYLRARRIRDLGMAIVIEPLVEPWATATLVLDARALLGSLAPGSDPTPCRLAFGVRGLALSDRTDLSLAETTIFDDSGAVSSHRPLSQRHAAVLAEDGIRTESVADGEVIFTKERIAEFAEVARQLEPLGRAVLRCVLPKSGDVVVVDVLPLEHHGFPGAGTATSLWARASVGETPALPLSPLGRHLLEGPTLERLRRFIPERNHRPRRSSRAASAVAVLDGRTYVNLSPILEGENGNDAVDPIVRVELVGAEWPPEQSRETVVRTSLARASLRIAQIATEQRALNDEVLRFEVDAERQRRWLAEMDLAILPDDALTTTLREVSDFLSRTYALHARASAAMLAGHALLSSMLVGIEPERASRLARAVAAGADVVTTKPARALCHVAAIARHDAAARAVLSGGARSVEALEDGPLRRAIEQFLGAYGDRGSFETELSGARWGEAPSALLGLLAVIGEAAPIDPDFVLSRARALADRKLATLESRLSFFETRVVRDLVSRQRELVRLRERCRAWLAHGLSMMRVVALDVDRRIRRLDAALDVGSAWMLTLDELLVAVAKHRTDLAPVVRARGDDYERRRRTPASSSVFRGVPRDILPFPVSVLRGQASSSGVAEGRVVRLGATLEGIHRFRPGDVLVVDSLDTGIVPFFFHAAAVVADLGTPFVSSAVAARDCGLPVVTGIFGASVLFRDGDRVRVDGDAGTAELLGQ